jgi:hypothetical protein
MPAHCSPEQMADYERDLRKHYPNPGLDKRLAVSALIGHCETIAASGDLTQEAEQSLRWLIAQTLAAFEMPSKFEHQVPL